jgi:orotidine-5'-phosphate decarboxylase
MKQGHEFIVFPLDVATADDARRWVDRLQGRVGMFKVGLELFLRCGPSIIAWIVEEAGCRVFLDLKLHDIPNTVLHAARGIADLKVSLTTVHCGESEAMLAAAVKGCGDSTGVLGVTVLTSVSAGDLRGAGYRTEMADDVNRLVMHKASLARAAGCAGVVCSGREVAGIKSRFGKDFLAITPGIRPDWQASRDDQQRVVTPRMAVADGADYLVIGRPIREASDPVACALRIADEIDKVSLVSIQK